MLVEIFIFFEIIVIALFITSFFTKQEILWGITLIMSGILMLTSWHVEHYIYEYNATLQAYTPLLVTHSYPYLMGINMIFFVLAMVLGMFDIFDKYGTQIKIGKFKIGK